MSDKKISELTQTTTINQADVSVLVSGGADYKFAFSTLLQFLGSNLAVGANISFGTTLPQNTSGKDSDVFINTNTGSFAQKLSGIWSVVYTLPLSDTQTDGTVLYGLGAPGSTTGNNNDTYINTGSGIFYKKTAGAWSQVFSMQSGPQGPQGVAGANGTNGTNGFSVLSGNNNPSNSATGVDGDFYINTSTYELFGPKTGGIWPEGVSLIPPGLKAGGITGQVLTKASNDDYDSEWSTLDVSFGGLSGEPGDNAALGATLDGKVDKVAGYGLSQENYTTSEKAKLSTLSEHYLGYYSSLSALQTAHSTANNGNYATVDQGIGENAINYIWDSNDNLWIKSGGIGDVTSVNSQTGAVILTSDDISESITNKYFTAARVLSSILTGIGFSSDTAVLATDSVLQGIGKLQAQFNALFKIPSGGITGQVLAKVDNTNGNVQWIDPPSEGISGLTAKQVLFGKSDGTVEQISAIEIDDSTGSLYIGNVGSAATSGGDIYFFGTSITGGTGSSGSGKRYTTIVANALGLAEHNNGVSASTLEKQSPVNATGGTNMIDRLANIPTKSSATKYLIFDFGINDVMYNGINYTDVNFKSDYEIVINDALSKGWSASDILIFSTTFMNPSSYGQPGTGGTPVITLTRHQTFNAAALAVSVEYGTMYFDVFNYISNRGGVYNLSDGIHPNDYGHALTAMGVLEILAGKVYSNGQSLAVNGVVEFLNLILKTKYVIPDGTGYMIGIDSNGKVGIVNTLKDGVKFNGNVNLVGQILQIGATNPAAGLGNNDILLKQDAKIWGVFNTNANFQNFIKLIDSSAHMLFSVTYNNAQFKFSTINGVVASINPTGDFTINGTVYSKALTITGGSGTYGSFEPYNTSNQTNIRNAYSGGYINFYVSNGVNAAQAKAFAINKMGRAIFQQSLPDNTDLALARLAINSTTEGFLTPRMTTSQRDTMSCLSTVTVGNFGSGYTTATVSITGGGGSGATATAQIEVGGTGRIIGYTLTNPGSGYTSLPTITVTGDGTGATVNRSIALDGHEGLEIYNLTTHKKNYYDGSSWQEITSVPV